MRLIKRWCELGNVARCRQGDFTSAIALVASLAVVIIASFGPMRFGQNDDAVIESLLRDYDWSFGDYSVPTFSKFTSNLLVGAYGVFPDVPWYGLTILVSLTIGLSLLTSWFIRLSFLFQFVTFPVVFCSVFYLVTRPSFTSVTLLCEFSAFLVVYSWLVSEREFRLPTVLIFLSLTFASMLRTELFISSLIFALPVLFVSGRLRRLSRFWLAITGCCVMCVLHVALGLQCMLTDETASFLAYDGVRSAFHDTNLASESSPNFATALSSAGWSENDYRTFKDWLMYDNSRFNSVTISKFLTENRAFSADSWFYDSLSTFDVSLRVNRRYLIASVAPLCFGVCLIVLTNDAVKTRRLLAIMSVIFGILLLFTIRAPERVAVPLILYAIGVVIPAASAAQEVHSKNIRKNLFCVVSVPTVIVLSYIGGKAKSDLALSRALIERAARIDETVAYARDHFGGRSVFISLNPSVGVGTAWRKPLVGVSREDYLNFLPVGWAINSPAYKSVLSSRDLSNGLSLIANSIDDPQFVYCGYFGYFSAEFENSWLQHWDEYVSDHFVEVSDGSKMRLRSSLDCRFPVRHPGVADSVESGLEGMVFFHLQSSQEELTSPLTHDAMKLSPMLKPVRPLF